MLKRILIGLATVIAVIFIAASFKSPHYLVKRSVAIKANSEKLFPYINNSELMNSWMPWIDSDPQIKMSYPGNKEGVGSIAAWESPGKMGVGQSKIVDSKLNHATKIEITYFKPMQMVQMAEMSLQTEGDTSTVTWSVEGEFAFFQKVIFLFMSLDDMIGPEFEKGLNKLKNIAEKN